MSHWYAVFLSLQPETQGSLEDISAELFECGAEGVEEPDNNSLIAYFALSETEIRESITPLLNRYQVELNNIIPIAEQNWVQSCLSLMSPLTIAALQIVPVVSAESVPSTMALYPHTVYIIPGMGFGTGHHPATALALELLQSNQLHQAKPRLAWDAGTGSGILAIAATKLYDTEIIGTDIDDAALDNAIENIAINGLTANITVLNATNFQPKLNHYPLITANIYAEVLVELEHIFFASLERSGYLILSGIMQEREPLIFGVFKEPKWVVQRHLTGTSTDTNQNWTALLLQKSADTV